MMTQVRDARGASAYSRVDGTVGLTMHFRDDDAVAEFRSEEIVISHRDAWSLLTQLIVTLQSQSNERMHSAVAGDCATCKNHRLFEQPIGHGGRMEYAHCPDCWERYNAATPALPKRLEGS